MRRFDLRRTFQTSSGNRVATLTGAIIYFFGAPQYRLVHVTTTRIKLADELLAAGKEANDTAWRMPIGELYNERLKSNFADMANIGGLLLARLHSSVFPRTFHSPSTRARGYRRHIIEIGLQQRCNWPSSTFGG